MTTITTERTITVVLNGVPREATVPVRWLLSDALRHEFGLTGTHVGCEHGVCGACTVLLDDAPVRACLVFAVQAEGSSVRTVESLADHGELSDLQQAFSDHHGLQCGFCTPGFLMLAEGVLAEQPDASREEIREGLSANLCRCTGYQTIVDAVHATACARRESAS
jgi:aerobic-type carbon monoxide dehydrogenase small subunit (CoxS/CutS family)